MKRIALFLLLSFVQAVLMAHVAFSAAVSHRTVEMTPVAAMARGEKVAAQMSRILVYYAPI